MNNDRNSIEISENENEIDEEEYNTENLKFLDFYNPLKQDSFMINFIDSSNICEEIISKILLKGGSILHDEYISSKINSFSLKLNSELLFGSFYPQIISFDNNDFNEIKIDEDFEPVLIYLISCYKE